MCPTDNVSFFCAVGPVCFVLTGKRFFLRLVMPGIPFGTLTGKSFTAKANIHLMANVGARALLQPSAFGFENTRLSDRFWPRPTHSCIAATLVTCRNMGRNDHRFFIDTCHRCRGVSHHFISLVGVLGSRPRSSGMLDSVNRHVRKTITS